MGESTRKIRSRILLALLIGVIIIPTIAYAYNLLILSDSYTLTIWIVDEQGKAVPDATVQIFITVPKGPAKLIDRLKTNSRGKAIFHLSIKNLTNPWIETNEWLAEHGGIANPGILIFAYYSGEKLGTTTCTLTIPWEIRGKGPITIGKTLKLKWNTINKSKVVKKAEILGYAGRLVYELAWSKEHEGYINLAYLKTDSHSQGTLHYKIYKYDYIAYKVTINEGFTGWELASGTFGSTTWIRDGYTYVGVGYNGEGWISIYGRVVWETWHLRYYYGSIPGEIVQTDYKTYIKYVVPDTLRNVKGDDYYNMEGTYKYYKTFTGKGVEAGNIAGSVEFDDFTADKEEHMVPFPYALAAGLIKEGLGDVLPGVALGVVTEHVSAAYVIYDVWGDVNYNVKFYYFYMDQYSVPMAWVKYVTYYSSSSPSPPPPPGQPTPT
mgnify:CR=1 FL=1